jgi:hypothetical protein
LLFRLSGQLLLRYADRHFWPSLFQLPPACRARRHGAGRPACRTRRHGAGRPRITRFEPVGRHPKAIQNLPAVGLGPLASGRFPEGQPQIAGLGNRLQQGPGAFHAGAGLKTNRSSRAAPYFSTRAFAAP